MKRSEYLSLRREFEPASVGLAIVAESPPASGKYFYDSKGTISEPPFSALMLQLNCAPVTKRDGLAEFQKRGWVLVDATYDPVNRLNEKERDAIIVRDYPLLHGDLVNLFRGRSAPIILIKANVCRLLDPLLTKDRFEVLNKGRAIYFPSTGRQGEFFRQFRAIARLT